MVTDVTSYLCNFVYMKGNSWFFYCSNGCYDCYVGNILLSFELHKKEKKK